MEGSYKEFMLVHINKKIIATFVAIISISSVAFAGAPITSNGMYIPAKVNDAYRYQDPFEGMQQEEIQAEINRKNSLGATSQQGSYQAQGIYIAPSQNIQSATQQIAPQQLTPQQLALQQALLNQMIANNNAVTSTIDIPSGYGLDGKAYGLARLADYLMEKGHGNVKFTSASKISTNKYNVVATGGDRYSNGTFVVDVYSKDKTDLSAPYQFWFGVYDTNGVKTGTAHTYKIK